MNAPGRSDLPPLTAEEVERTAAALDAKATAISLFAYLLSLDIDQLMTERLQLEDLSDEMTRAAMTRWIDHRIAALQAGEPNDNRFQ